MALNVYYNEVDRNAAEWLRALIADGLIPAGTVDERSITQVQPADLDGYTQCHFFAGIGGWPYALALAGWQGPAWTGSCSCQPLSVAGQGHGDADERHLWPAFQHLIAECRPATVFGEQVAGKHGREWLAGIRADLESSGYAIGAANLCAAGVGAPHIRQRLYWVGDAAKLERYTKPDNRHAAKRHTTAPRATGTAFWADADRLPCLDGKARRVEPGIQPLADGVPARLGRLRGYGNAIVPQVAAAFVSAFMEARDGAL